MKKQFIHRVGGYLLLPVVFCLVTSGVAQTSAEQPSGVAEEKEPLLALAMSALIPGLGQYYNGDIAKGVIQELMVFGGFVFALTAGIEERGIYYNDYYFEYYETELVLTDSFWLGLGVSAAGYIWSVIDAPLSAMHKNKQRVKKRYGHLLKYDASNGVLGLDVKSNHSTVGLQLTLHL